MVRQPPSIVVVAALCWLLLTRTPTVENAYDPGKEECEFPNHAVSYSGSLNITIGGEACESWKDAREQFEDVKFSDGSVSKAKNYCRNPMPTTRTHVWCFVKNTPGVWQYCRVCPYADYKGCQLPNKGSDYSGFVAFTRSNIKCQSWTSNKPHRLTDSKSYRFVDGSAKQARNYCRNPTPQSKAGVWCYTTDPNLVWDYCEVCKPFRGKVQTMSATTAYESFQAISQVKTRHVCLYFCLINTECVAADFDGHSSECSHGEKLVFDKTPHGSSTVYVIQRVCPTTAMGDGRKTNDFLGTYIRVQGQSSREGTEMPKADTPNKCILTCVQFKNCVKAQFGGSSMTCYAFETMYTKSDADEKSSLYIMQRCKKNVVASEDVVPQEGEEETEAEVEINPGFWADIVDSSTVPDDNSLLVDAVTFKAASVSGETGAVGASGRNQMNDKANAFGTQSGELNKVAKTVVIKTGKEDQSSVRGYAKRIEMAVIAFTVITVICTGYQIYKEKYRNKESIEPTEVEKIEPTIDERKKETKAKKKRKKSKTRRKRDTQRKKLLKIQGFE